MFTHSLILEAYTPQLHLGDWQIVVSVNRRKNRIAVERWHSSEYDFEAMARFDQTIRIKTGIRAFRRHMPILAGALEKISVVGKSVDEIVEAVFAVLMSVYRSAREADQFNWHDGQDLNEDFADFLQHRKREALAALSAGMH